MKFANQFVKSEKPLDVLVSVGTRSLTVGTSGVFIGEQCRDNGEPERAN